MKQFLRSRRAIPVYAFLALMVGAFFVGALVPIRFEGVETDATPIADGAIEGGFATMWAALVAGPLLPLAAALRVMAYTRFDRKFVLKDWFWLGVLILESIAVFALLNVLWTATNPVVDSGFALITYFFVALIVTGISATFLVVAILMRPKADDGMEEAPQTLPAA